MRFLSRLTLPRRIGLLMFLGLFLGTGAFAFLSLQALNRSTETRLQERMDIARLVADQEGRTLQAALNIIEGVSAAADSQTEEIIAGPRVESLISGLSQLGISVTGIFLLDGQGMAIWGTAIPVAPSGAAGQSFADYPSVTGILETGRSSISPLVSTPAFDSPTVLLATPIRRTSVSARILVVAIDPSRFSTDGLAQPIRLGQTGYVEVVDENGKVLARTQPGTPLSPFETSDHPERFAFLIKAEQPTVRTCHRCHEETGQTELRKDVLAFAPVPLARWGVVIRQSEDEALAPTRDLRQKLMMAGGLLVAISIGLVWVATSDPVSRLTALKRASSGMAGGDLSTPIPAYGKDEIGSLAETLDAARIKLKASYEEIEQRTKELASLLSISQTLVASPDFATVLQTMTAKALEAIGGADGGALLLYDQEASLFSLGATAGLSLPCEPGITVACTAERDSQLNAASTTRDFTTSDEWPAQVGELTSQGCAGFLTLMPEGRRPSSVACSPLVCKGQYMGALVLVSFDGGTGFTEADLRLLRIMGGEMAMVMDNAQLSRKAEEARVLQETDRLKSQFISTVSHELRTPLTSIKGYASSLLRPEVSWDEGTKREFLQAIDEKADELRDLIDKLLQMSRVEAGVLQIRKEPVLVNHLARKMITGMGLRNPKHVFTTDFPTPFPVTETDSGDVEIVLRNLLDNAVKYSPEGGEITVAGEVGDGEVVISVADHGIGIPAKDLDRVFDRFYRVQGPLTWRISGSGLGLSVVKALVETHGGRVWVSSEEGKGSTFYFSLPVESV